MKKRLLGAALALCFLVSLFPARALDTDSLNGKTVILYTANLRGNIGALAQIAALKAEYHDAGADVILADAGNFLQGTVYASYDSGKTVIALMDEVGYDIVALGSHEFDFGTGQVGVERHEVYYADDTLGKLLEDSALSAVSANIFTGGGEVHAFAPSVSVTTASGLEIGFFGLTSPDTVNRVLETNLDGLSFAGAESAAHAQIAALAACDLIVGLSNLGNLPALEGAVVIDADESDGLIVGAIVIDNASGAVESREAVDLAAVTPDAAVQAAVDAAKETVDAEYPAGTVVKSEVTLEGRMSANRSRETNTGDLWADALAWFATEGGIESYYDEDEIAAGNTGIAVDAAHIVAVWNGGNLRDFLNTGDVTMKDIQRVLPYPNRVAVVYLTGAQLLEMLEAATQGLPHSEASAAACASFAQVSGIKYIVAAGTPYDAAEAYGANWFTAGSIRRVSIESINGTNFDEDARYAVITSNAIANGMDSNYICREKDADLSTITTATVVDVVWMYINQKLGGVIGAQYTEPQGRITVDLSVGFSDVVPGDAFYSDIVYAVENGLMHGVDADVFEPGAAMTRADFISALYRLAGAPAADAESMAFADVPQGAPYAKAVAWAAANGITSGTAADAFSPDALLTREQMATLIYNYCGKPAAGAQPSFGDAAEVSAWAISGVLFCVDNGYLSIEDTAFGPADAATRAVAASALARLHAIG